MIVVIIILAAACCLLIIYAVRLLHRIAAAESALAVAQERLNSATGRLARIETDMADTEAALLKATADIASEHDLRIRAEADTARLKDQLETAADMHEKERKATEEQQRRLMEQSEANFRVLANEIMQRHTATMREQNEQRLGEILTPLKENIDRFRQDVSQCYNNEARERFSLQERIKELIEANNSISREAKELSTALRGNAKKQGDWGEFVLESILERSGLRKGEEFTVQQTTDENGITLRDEAGRGLRPDVVVHYPDGRAMVIDSKVSLNAFVDYVNAENAEEQERHGKLHLASVMKHINELSDKSYQDYIGRDRLDFVMMFIPNEGAYSAAMSLDPTLWQKAYDKRVLIVSPTQLVGSLRLISQLWSHDRQTRNAIDIAEKSGQMYDKFVGFVSDMERIEKSLDAARTAYENAIKKLRDGRGNLIGRAEALRQLGIKTSKRLRETTETADSDDPADEYPQTKTDA